MTIDWETPPEFFKKLDSEFHFTLDPCATIKTAKCEKFFTEDDNGLGQDWTKDRVFMNPPFDKVKMWVKKAYETSQSGGYVVCLVPCRNFGSGWWHDYALKSSEIRFIRGRLNFLKDGIVFKRPACSTTVVIFKPYCTGPPRIKSMNR